MASGVNCCGTGGGDGGEWRTRGGGWPWPGVVLGAGEIGADSEAVAPADSETVTPGDEATAAVGELAGSGGGGGGGEDMVETRVPDTKLVGLGFLPAQLRRL